MNYDELDWLMSLAAEQGVRPEFGTAIRTGDDEWTTQVSFPGLKIPVPRRRMQAVVFDVKPDDKP